MAKPLEDMFTDSFERAVLDRASLIPMTIQSNVPPVMVPEEVLTLRFCGIVRVAVEGSTYDDARVSDACGERAALITPPRFVASGETRSATHRRTMPSSISPLFRRRVLAQDVELAHGP